MSPKNFGRRLRVAVWAKGPLGFDGPRARLQGMRVPAGEVGPCGPLGTHWALGTLWGYSEAIPSGKLFRVDGFKQHPAGFLSVGRPETL